jgi:hypothetical protein
MLVIIPLLIKKLSERGQDLWPRQLLFSEPGLGLSMTGPEPTQDTILMKCNYGFQERELQVRIRVCEAHKY